jgi:hypothetical protein
MNLISLVESGGRLRNYLSDASLMLAQYAVSQMFDTRRLEMV